MDLQDLKRWHWIVISLILGGLLGWTRMSIGPDEQFSEGRRGIDAYDFAREVAAPKSTKGFPFITDIVVYPPQAAPNPDGKTTHLVNFLTCREAVRQADGMYRYVPCKLTAEVPFHASNFVKAKSDTYSICDYLNEVKQDHPDVSYRYASWASPWASFGIWMGGAVLLLGGVWPTLIGLLTGAGLGRQAKVKDDYDLDRFGKSGEKASSGIVFGKPGISNADAQKLRDMQDQMEQDVAGMKMTSAPAAADDGHAPFAEGVRKLAGGPVESQVTKNAEDEAKEYKGEFYPVVKSGKASKSGDEKA